MKFFPCSHALPEAPLGTSVSLLDWHALPLIALRPLVLFSPPLLFVALLGKIRFPFPSSQSFSIWRAIGVRDHTLCSIDLHAHISPHGQSWNSPDESAESLCYNDTDALAPPLRLSRGFLYFTSSRRVFATFPKLSTQPTLNLTLALREEPRQSNKLRQGQQSPDGGPSCRFQR